MIVRINDDNTAVIVKSVSPQEEDLFLQINSQGSIQFKKVDSLPESRYGFYIYDPTTDTFSLDTQRELAKAKEEQLQRIKDDFYRFRQETGRMISNVLSGTMVDARDKEAVNLQLLCEKYPDDSTISVQYRVYDNSFVTITGSQLHSLKQEMIDYGLSLYQHKWTLEDNVNNATTLDDVDSQVFDEEEVVTTLSPYQPTTT